MVLSVVRRLRVFLGKAHMQVDKFPPLVVGSLQIVFRCDFSNSQTREPKCSKSFRVGKEV